MGAGVDEAVGIDGAHVDPALLEIPRARFRALDVGRPFDLGRRFDIVQCLEVAEHLPAADARTLVESLVRHGAVVLFSAAVPGQGGESHVNERPLSFWRSLFHASGYVPFDCVRAALRGQGSVEPWYRYNTILYVSATVEKERPAWIRVHRVADSLPFRTLAPWSWRLRCAALRLLPQAAITRLAVLKHRAIARSRR